MLSEKIRTSSLQQSNYTVHENFLIKHLECQGSKVSFLRLHRLIKVDITNNTQKLLSMFYYHTVFLLVTIMTWQKIAELPKHTS